MRSRYAPLLVSLLLTAFLPALGADAAWLDVSIRVFDSRIPETAPESPASESAATTMPTGTTTPEVQLAERRYLPLFLRLRLEASGRFGAVRVLPELDNGAQLMIEGTILASDGRHLALALTARDSTGHVWIDRTYEGAAVPGVNMTGDPLAQDDFAWLFAAIERDLVAMLDSIDETQRERIHNVALLRYGLGLVPGSFSGYLSENSDGTVTVLRLPATDDPLLRRIEAIREHEYLFIDVVDEEYRQFFTDVKPVYDLWRRFQREQAESTAAFVARETTASGAYARGSYYALKEIYTNYSWAKVQDQYLDELREGFANEVEPTEIELSDSLYRLSGTLEQQYREWRAILAELYELEAGLL